MIMIMMMTMMTMMTMTMIIMMMMMMMMLTMMLMMMTMTMTKMTMTTMMMRMGTRLAVLVVRKEPALTGCARQQQEVGVPHPPCWISSLPVMQMDQIHFAPVD